MKKVMWRTLKGVKERQELIESKKNFIMSLKEQVGCNVCGITHPSILVLHHVEPKVQLIGSRQPNGFNWLYNGWPKILKEISKCIVLCLNHHGLAHEQIDKQREYMGVPMQKDKQSNQLSLVF